MARNPEQLLISSVLRSGNHVVAAGQGVNAKLFHTYKKEWGFIEQYIGMHRKAPSKAAFKAKFPDFTIIQADDVEHFCEAVKESHAHHVLSNLIKDGVSALKTGESTAAVTALHNGVVGLRAELDGRADDSNVVENWTGSYEEVKNRFRRRKSLGSAGIQSGFPTLDNRTGGMNPGELWIVAARLGQGKTWTLVKMACSALISGFTVQYDSLEQSRGQISLRVHTLLARELSTRKFKASELMKGTSGLREYREFLRELPDMLQGKLHVSDTARGRVSPLTVAAQIEKNQPHAVFIDYLTLMERAGDDWRGVADLSAALKQTATQYEVPIITASQINRQGVMGRDQVPGAETLALSDAIGQDADGVITMRQISSRVVKMKLAKYRHGADGYEWFTMFDPNAGLFKECSRDEAMSLRDEDDDDE